MPSNKLLESQNLSGCYSLLWSYLIQKNGVSTEYTDFHRYSTASLTNNSIVLHKSIAMQVNMSTKFASKFKRVKYTSSPQTCHVVIPVPELIKCIFGSLNLALGVIPVLKLANCIFDSLNLLSSVVPVPELINYTFKSLNLRHVHLLSSHRHGSRRCSQHNLRAPSIPYNVSLPLYALARVWSHLII
jgi:hypothetical protein